MNNKITQKDLVMEWVKIYGSIIPARMAGKVWNFHMFGSETSRACRSLRREGKLVSGRSKECPKFEEFKLPGQSTFC